MTKQQKVFRYWAKNKGGYIQDIGNGMHILIKYPLDVLGLVFDSSRITVTSHQDIREIHNLYFNILPNISIESILQAVLIGDNLYKVNSCLCEQTGYTPAGYTGRYHIIGQEIYGLRNK